MSDLCAGCQRPLQSHDAIAVGSMEEGYRDLCSRCFNQEMAEQNGLEFEHVSFQPIELTDASGVLRRYHFLLRLLGGRVALDAFEIRAGGRFGRGFQMIDEVGVDLFDLMKRLMERVRRALARRHLTDGEYGLQIADSTIRGEISCDLNDEARSPVLLIDGREISWDELGRMLMTFEGWSFKLEIKDPSEEV